MRLTELNSYPHDQSRMRSTEPGDSNLEELSEFKIKKSPKKKQYVVGPLKPDGGIGPGEYDPNIVITRKKAPSTSWSKYRSKRMDYGKSSEAPGPGNYN